MVDDLKKSPRIGPKKEMNKENNISFRFVSVNVRVQKFRFSAFPGGPGGFREVREAGRNHFHLSWYLSVSVVTSYGQKPGRGVTVDGVWPYTGRYRAPLSTGVACYESLKAYTSDELETACRLSEPIVQEDGKLFDLTAQA